MKAAARSRRDRIRAQLADLKMPGALEAIDDVLTSEVPPVAVPLPMLDPEPSVVPGVGAS